MFQVVIIVLVIFNHFLSSVKPLVSFGYNVNGYKIKKIKLDLVVSHVQTSLRWQSCVEIFDIYKVTYLSNVWPEFGFKIHKNSFDIVKINGP
jgi:hypothetical protein